MRQDYVRPQVIKIGTVAALTLTGSGAHGGGGSKPGLRIDGSGCETVPIGQGNNGNGPCKN